MVQGIKFETVPAYAKQNISPKREWLVNMLLK